MRICIGGDPKDTKRGRWQGDPIALNDEAFFLSKDNQCKALDFMEDAPPEIRVAMSSIWKYCFCQWLIYDAGCEAERNNSDLAEILSASEMAQDIDALKGFCESGGLEKAKKSEKWSWKMLEALPASGTSERGDDAAPMVQAAREERSEGVDSFHLEHYSKAFWHFNQGIRFLARLPEPLTPVQSKLGCDLFKNIAAAALKLNMNRAAFNAAQSAINLYPDDQKAWFRKASALQNLDREEEATVAFLYAGYTEVEKELGPPVDAPPEGTAIDQAMQESLERLAFLECGIDSMDAVEVIVIVQEQLPLYRIPQDLLFSCPTVGQAAAFVVENAGSDFKATAETLWRAMCKVLGRDPLHVKSVPKLMSEEKALGALLFLLESYEAPEYVSKAKQLAKKVNYEYKPFLVHLRRHALQMQLQTLEIRSYPGTYEGMRKLECSIIACASKSRQVKDLLQTVRKACYGGQDGMWPIVMEGGKPKKA